MSNDIANPQREPGTAKLIFPRGAADLSVSAGNAGGLATGSFSGPQPEVTSAGNTVFVRYPRGPGRTRGELRLDPAVEWSIESRRGVAEWTADLTGLRLAALRIAGGASRLWLDLPAPAHRVDIEVDEGVDRVTIVRPSEVGVVVQIGRRASNLIFDNQRFKAISGEVRLESENSDPSAGSYQIRIGSGARRLTMIASPGLANKDAPRLAQ